MRLKRSRWAIPIAVLFAWLGSSLWPRHTDALLQTTFGGSATAALVRVPVTGTTLALADTAPLPAAGGGVGAALLAGRLPGNLTAGIVTLTAGTLHAAAVGLDRTQVDASLADMNLAVSGNGITTGFLMARSEASCDAAPAVTGSSQLANLVINGQAIVITGAPNQAVVLPNGRAIINEQIPSVLGTSGQLTVNALHVTTRDVVTGQPLADVVLASANAQVQCQGGVAWNFRSLELFDVLVAQTDPGQFTTGGGWIPGIGGGHANFGFIGGIQQDGTTMGHVVFNDHNLNFSMESTSITSVDTSACSATIYGNGTSSGTPVQFIVTVHDGGEPGRSDTFHIAVSNGYENTGVLAGGNIQADGSFAGGRVLAHRPGCS